MEFSNCQHGSRGGSRLHGGWDLSEYGWIFWLMRGSRIFLRKTKIGKGSAKQARRREVFFSRRERYFGSVKLPSGLRRDCKPPHPPVYLSPVSLWCEATLLLRQGR